jgi:hypothetical protein
MPTKVGIHDFRREIKAVVDADLRRHDAVEAPDKSAIEAFGTRCGPRRVLPPTTQRPIMRITHLRTNLVHLPIAD